MIAPQSRRPLADATSEEDANEELVGLPGRARPARCLSLTPTEMVAVPGKKYREAPVGSTCPLAWFAWLSYIGVQLASSHFDGTTQ